jgi:hypothetical protein
MDIIDWCINMKILKPLDLQWLVDYIVICGLTVHNVLSHGEYNFVIYKYYFSTWPLIKFLVLRWWNHFYVLWNKCFPSQATGTELLRHLITALHNYEPQNYAYEDIKFLMPSVENCQ